MIHRAVDWADQGERPLRGVNVAEVIGTALDRSLVLITVRREQQGRQIGQYLETYDLADFQCALMEGQAAHRNAASVSTGVRNAASYFVSRIEEIRAVRAVVLEVSGAEARLLTYIERRDRAVRSRIYALEREVYEMFPDPAIDFRVISLDTTRCSFPAEDTKGTHLLLRR